MNSGKCREGGNGGAATAGSGGTGGDGGVGVQFTTSGATFTNSGTVRGGNGGAAGIGIFVLNGSPGSGGAGIIGSGLTVINIGTISGGLGGNGSTRANAITFTGGTNTLELQPGSSIIDNVVAASTADTLALGGSGSAIFDVSQIGSNISRLRCLPENGHQHLDADPQHRCRDPLGDQRRHAGGLGG